MIRTLFVALVLSFLTASASAQVPRFCVASLDGSIVRLREFRDGEPRTQDVQVVALDKDGKPVTRTVKVTSQSRSETVVEIGVAEVKGYDAAGKEIDADEVSKLLKKEIPVVLLDNGQKPSPGLTAVLKKGVVVLSVPVSLAQLQGPVWGGTPTPTPRPLPAPAPKD